MEKSKEWRNKQGEGYSIELSHGYLIKVVSWYNYDFTEITLLAPSKIKGRLNIKSGRLGYSVLETARHIQTALEEHQIIAKRLG